MKTLIQAGHGNCVSADVILRFGRCLSSLIYFMEMTNITQKMAAVSKFSFDAFVGQMRHKGVTKLSNCMLHFLGVTEASFADQHTPGFTAHW